VADSKVSALTELTALTGDETLYIVEDDDGTPVSRRVTIENLAAGLASLTYSACRLTKSADQSIGASSTAAVSFDGEAFDTGLHDNATNNTRITNTTGATATYLVGAGAQSNTARAYIAYFRVNGTTQIPGGGRNDLATASAAVTIPPTIIELANTDYVEFVVQNTDAGASLVVRGGSGNSVYASFWATKIS
jgi:hypothetical protein